MFARTKLPNVARASCPCARLDARTGSPCHAVGRSRTPTNHLAPSRKVAGSANRLYMNTRQIAAQIPPVWSGDLVVDCSAKWTGYTLRAERMQKDLWWWCVYDDATGEQVVSSNNSSEQRRTGESARTAAEQAARQLLGLPYRRTVASHSEFHQHLRAKPAKLGLFFCGIKFFSRVSIPAAATRL
jgi:hypothetical protein